MSTNELNTIARDLKELSLMAEQLDTEIKTLEDTIKTYMGNRASRPSYPSLYCGESIGNHIIGIILIPIFPTAFKSV